MPQERDVYLQITNIIDTNITGDRPVTADDLQQILIRIVQAFNETEIVVNYKDTGIYSTVETNSNQTFPPNPNLTSLTSQTPEERPVLRKLVTFGALPNNTTKSIDHDIDVTANTQWTRIYGTATKPTTTYGGIPLPYLDDTTYGSNVTLRVDNQKVYVKTTADMTAFSKCWIIVEYTQD